MKPFYHQIADLFQVPAAEGTYRLQHPQDADSTREDSESMGKVSLSEGDYESAIEHFKRAIKKANGPDAIALANLGGAYEAADMLPQALRQYEKALRLKQSAELRVGLADMYGRYGRAREMIQKLSEAIELEPDNPFCHFKLAEAKRRSGFREEALRSAHLAVACAPDQSFYHFWLGDLLIEMRRFDEALEAFHAAIELSPGDDYLFAQAAMAFRALGRQAEALKAVRLASDLDPTKNLYHGLLERLYAEMGLEEESKQEQSRSRHMDAYDFERLGDWFGRSQAPTDPTWPIS